MGAADSEQMWTSGHLDIWTLEAVDQGLPMPTVFEEGHNREFLILPRSHTFSGLAQTLAQSKIEHTTK
jgi:hypothetical protein